MTVWGIGKKWVFVSLLLCSPLLFVVGFFRESLVVTSLSPWWFYGTGIALLLFGIPFWFIAAVTLRRAYDAEELCTTGVFSLCRNPIYAAWILFLLPGGLLFFRAPLLFLIPLLFYGVLRQVFPKEDAWLEKKYGEAYRLYRERVPFLLPTPRRFLRTTSSSTR